MERKITKSQKDQLKESILNLHDVFLNASLQRRMMFASPVTTDILEFSVSDRARFERTYVLFLFVFYEAWNSKNAKQLKKFLKNELDLANLDTPFRKFLCSGLIKSMEETRDYMSHRDLKSYWDVGRTSFYGRANELEQMFQIISELHLFAFEQLEKLE